MAGIFDQFSIADAMAPPGATNAALRAAVERISADLANSKIVLEGVAKERDKLKSALADLNTRAWRDYVRMLDCTVATWNAEPDRICDRADAIAAERRRREGGK